MLNTTYLLKFMKMTRLQKSLFVVIVLLMLISFVALMLRDDSQTPNKSVKIYEVGELTEDGRLIFLAYDNGVYRALDYNYGMRIIEFQNNSEIETRYEFYDQKKKSIKSTNSIVKLEGFIETMPPGETIYYYNKYCGYSPILNNKSILQTVKEICRKYGVNFEASEFAICTCPPPVIRGTV
jgi:hypothetical protein